MKSYKLYVELSYTKEVQAESHEDAFLMAEEAVLDDFFEWECVNVEQEAVRFYGRPDEKDAPPRGIRMIKDMTPFQCGQEDSFFNRKLNPRMVKDGAIQTLSEVELIQEYINGYIDTEEFYAM